MGSVAVFQASRCAYNKLASLYATHTQAPYTYTSAPWPACTQPQKQHKWHHHLIDWWKYICFGLTEDLNTGNAYVCLWI